MAAHDHLPQIFYGGAWHVITDDVIESESIKMTRGLTEDSRPRPSKIEWRFNNAADTYRPTNPTSPLYGLAGRNMLVAHVVDGVTRSVGEASEYRPGQTLDFDPAGSGGMRWVDLTAEGIQRRIGQWTTPIRSALFRQIRQYDNLTGYWPLEDGRDATRLSNAYPAGRSGTVKGAELGIDGGPAGAESVAKTVAGSTMSGRFVAVSATTSGWQVSFAVKLAATPTTGDDLFTWRTSNGYLWRWQADAGGYDLVVTSGDTVLLSGGVGRGVSSATGWLCYRVKVSDAGGGNVHAEAAWFAEDQHPWGFDWTFAGTPGALQTWTVPGNPVNDGALYGHVFGVKGTTDNLQSYAATRAFTGYRGEYSVDRFTRLCGEERVPCSVLDPAEDAPVMMGPQRPAVFSDLLREVADTCDGLLYDGSGGLGLVLRTGRDRYGQTPALALTWPGQVNAPFDEVIDDQDTANVVTARNAAGGEVTVALTSGAMSTQAAPDGVGEYKRTVDVCVDDEATLRQIAGWYLAAGTIEGARYPRVTVDLDAHPELAAAANAVDVGDVITVTGRDPDPIRLSVLGIEESSRRFRRVVTFVCRRDVPYAHVRRYDAPAARYDSASTTLAGAATAAAAAAWWRFTSTSGTLGWLTVGGSVAVPADALVFTPNGTTASVEVRSPFTPVTAGNTYAGSAPVTCAVSRTVTPLLIWRNAAGTLLSSTSGAAVAMTAGVQQELAVSGTAPTGATQAQLSLAMGSTPPASNTLTVASARVGEQRTWVVQSTDRADTWSTTAEPYDWMIAGERVTVTAMTSPTLTSGTWQQTATVVRAINGVSKSQAAGAVVRLADPTRYAL